MTNKHLESKHLDSLELIKTDVRWADGIEALDYAINLIEEKERKDKYIEENAPWNVLLLKKESKPKLPDRLPGTYTDASHNDLARTINQLIDYLKSLE